MNLLENINLTEDSRSDLIRKSKASDNYVPWYQYNGRNRFERRTKSLVANTVKQYNEINMNKLFLKDRVEINVNVHGETSEYVVKIAFEGFLKSLKLFLPANATSKDVTYRAILRALLDAMNNHDVFVHCTCPDWRYRQDYWAHVNKTASTDRPDDALDRPSDITNPNDTKGGGCKHVNLVLNNSAWVMKLASVINNYIHYMQDNYEDLYQRIIYPAIFDKPYDEKPEEEPEEPIEEPIDEPEEEPELPSDSTTVDTSNEYNKERTKFKQGNKQGIRFISNKDAQDIDNFKISNIKKTANLDDLY